MKLLINLAAAMTVFASAALGSGKLSDKRKDLGPFLFVHEQDTQDSRFGMVMKCPSHAHGTAEEAFEKLAGIVAARPPERCNSIDVCRYQQLETLERFAPLANRVIVNPFAYTSTQPPEASTLIWPGADHPFLNHIRLVRAGSSETRLVAKLPLDGPKRFFKKRKASFEEVRWMVYAVIGANVQGVAWRYRKLAEMPFEGRIEEMVSALEKYDADLGKAEPVGWAKGEQGQPISAICSKDMLCIVLLSDDYFRLDAAEKNVVLPLNPRRRSGAVRLVLPDGVTLLSAETLLGLPLEIDRRGEAPAIHYAFDGAGKILVVWISTQLPEGTRIDHSDSESGVHP